MYEIASNADVTIGRDSRGPFVVFEGKTTWIGSVPKADDLREQIESEEQRQMEAARRLRRDRAMLALLEANEAEADRLRREQRNERAAATRAHNADPFGFKAAGYTS